jgi:predicted metal-dependent hydrolase
MDLPDNLDCTIQKRPNKVVSESLAFIFADVDERVKVYARQLIAQGWKFYIVDQRGGWCQMSSKTIVLPWSVWNPQRNKPADYKTYFVAHEMAHAFDRCISDHGGSFMEWLNRICPVEMQHYEYEYKPRNAKRNGLSIVGGL